MLPPLAVQDVRLVGDWRGRREINRAKADHAKGAQHETRSRHDGVIAERLDSTIAQPMPDRATRRPLRQSPIHHHSELPIAVNNADTAEHIVENP